MLPGQGAVDVKVTVEAGLGSGDHGAAGARDTDADDDLPNAKGPSGPGVLEPVAAVGVEQQVGTEPAHVPDPVGMQRLDRKSVV